jgi:hypothetical protein
MSGTCPLHLRRPNRRRVLVVEAAFGSSSVLPVAAVCFNQRRCSLAVVVAGLWCVVLLEAGGGLASLASSSSPQSPAPLRLMLPIISSWWLVRYFYPLRVCFCRNSRLCCRRCCSESTIDLFAVVVLNRLVVGLCLFPLLGSNLARNGLLLTWFLFQLVVGCWLLCWRSVSLTVPQEMCSDFSSSSLVLLNACNVLHIIFFCNLILDPALGLLGCAFDVYLFAAHLAPRIYPVVFILPLMCKFIIVVLPF